MRNIILASVAVIALTGAAVAGDNKNTNVTVGQINVDNSVDNIKTINMPLSGLTTLPAGNLQLNGAVAGFASKHVGEGKFSGSTNNGKIDGKADFSGVSQVGTAVRTDVVKDAAGNPVRLSGADSMNAAQTITNPIAGVMTGTSGSQVGGSAALTTHYGNVSGSVKTDATSQGAAGGFTLGGQVGSISQIR